MPPYSPERRTALVLTGTGAAGAYHAGVLQALQEAGVKIDIVAGRGVGVAGAMFSAVDAGDQLWGAPGDWSSPVVGRFYRWRWTVRLALLALGVTAALLLTPVALLATGLFVLPAAVLLQWIGWSAGDRLAAQFSAVLGALFEPGALPLHLPRVVVIALLLVVLVLAGGALTTWLRARLRRRGRGGPWWALVGSPLDPSQATSTLVNKLWRVVCGTATARRPDPDEFGARYAQLLRENMDQPGFRELVVLAHDLDARGDVVGALLSDAYREPFLAGRIEGANAGRALETLDLAADDCRCLADLIAASLSLPPGTDPHLVRLPREGPWQGETHRLCDRPQSTARLLEEVANAGAEQVILVTANPLPAGPGRLTSGRRDARGRIGETLAAAESASVRDALVQCGGLFEAVFQIRPDHNPLGPLDLRGAYDEHTDRRQTPGDLLVRGHEDAFSQFVHAVVGASGEWIDAP